MKTRGGWTCWKTAKPRQYAAYFDIDWHPPAAKAAFLQENRVLLPVLGDLYGNVLAARPIRAESSKTPACTCAISIRGFRSTRNRTRRC